MRRGAASSGRFDARGVSFDNALKLSEHYLEGFGWTTSAVGAPLRLAVVEVLDRDGHARQVVPVARWPVTIGRAIDCDVVLDDPFVAAHHATLEEIDGVLTLVVGQRQRRAASGAGT